MSPQERVIKEQYVQGVKMALVEGVLNAVRGKPLLRVLELQGVSNGGSDASLIHPDATLLKPLCELTDAALSSGILTFDQDETTLGELLEP